MRNCSVRVDALVFGSSTTLDSATRATRSRLHFQIGLLSCLASYTPISIWPTSAVIVHERLHVA